MPETRQSPHVPVTSGFQKPYRTEGPAELLVANLLSESQLSERQEHAAWWKNLTYAPLRVAV